MRDKEGGGKERRREIDRERGMERREARNSTRAKRIAVSTRYGMCNNGNVGFAGTSLDDVNHYQHQAIR